MEFDTELPDDWRWVRLGELAAPSCRAIVSGPFGSNIGTKYFVATGVPVIRGSNLTTGAEKFVDEGFVFVTPEKARSLGNVDAVTDDLVFTAAGSLGQVGIIPKKTRYPLYIISNKQMRVRVNRNLVDPLFAFQWLSSPSVVAHIRQQNTGSSVPLINLTILRQLPVPLPPLPEQKRIAHILGTLDEKIELNSRMNTTLEAMARALFQSWFVDFDPVRRNAEGGDTRPEDSLFPGSFEESAIGRIPSGWQDMPLYETATYRNGAAFKAADFCQDGEGNPVVKIAELKSGLTGQTKWSQKELASDQMIDTGDLLYSWSGSPDTSLDAFLWSNGPGLLNQHIFKVITSSEAEKRFVYYLLKHLRPVLVETARDKQTTGLGHVTVADMKRLRVCRPPRNVLVAFDGLVAPIFDKAFANTIENHTLTAIRDTLLPKLLTGDLNTSKLDMSA